MRPRIVTLCGSTRFKDAWLEAQRRFTMAGIIVLTVGSYTHTEHPDGDKELVYGDQKAAEMDALHRRKIEMSDFIYVLNVGGYIGESTKAEIAHAEYLNIEVRYHE